MVRSFFKIIKGLLGLSLIILAAGGGFVLWRYLTVNQTVEQLLAENSELKTAITNLTEESQIGYAKVTAQETRDGVLYTRILFVEADPEDVTRTVFKQEYEIEGDIVHFDALIVKFTAPMVMDGREKAIYLWRRIYGETMRPEDGYPLQTPGREPARYWQICKKLSIREREMFWNEIWDLSNDPKKLEKQGIQAVFGNVVYRKLRPGLIYVFKVSTSGALYPEMVPDLMSQ